MQLLAIIIQLPGCGHLATHFATDQFQSLLNELLKIFGGRGKIAEGQRNVQKSLRTFQLQFKQPSILNFVWTNWMQFENPISTIPRFRHTYSSALVEPVPNILLFTSSTSLNYR